jgi:hypothetical protein
VFITGRRQPELDAAVRMIGPLAVGIQAGSGANRVIRSAMLGSELGWGSAMDKLKNVEDTFAGRHFDREVIILCVRWYLRFKLSFRDFVASAISWR